MANFEDFLSLTDQISENVMEPISMPFTIEYPMLIIHGTTRVELQFFKEQDNFLYEESDENRLLLIVEVEGMRKKLGYMEINFKNLIRLSSLKQRSMDLHMKMGNEVVTVPVDDQFYMMSLAMNYD